MSLDDRDYMRGPRAVRRASDQRRPGDPRRADEVFLPGTTHGEPLDNERRHRGFDASGARYLLAIALASAIVVGAVGAFVFVKLLHHG